MTYSTPDLLQVAVSVVCAIFTGIRGGLFTLAMVRLNVRVRTRLFASLLSQDVGFYDVNKTGELLLQVFTEDAGCQHVPVLHCSCCAVHELTLGA